MRAQRFRPGHEGIPENHPDYEYENGCSKPSRSERPHLTEYEMSDFLLSCPTTCFWWLWPWHECNTLEDGTSHYTKLLPKKKSSWPLRGQIGNEAWGLNCVYKISGIRVFLWHLLAFSLSFIYTGWHLSEDPGDLQTALAPAGLVLAFISAFWAGSGILNFNHSKSD